MGHVGRKTVAALAVLVAAACGTASGSVLTLASYAAGSWGCSATIRQGGQSETVKPSAVVKTTSATTGPVTITIRFAGVPGAYKYSGQWSLQSGELDVKWDKHALGTAQAKPISLDTKQFKIRSGRPGEAKWSKVTVDRKSRSVTFGFPLEPGGPPDQSMTCRKA
jgi:hypothetical protein